HRTTAQPQRCFSQPVRTTRRTVSSARSHRPERRAKELDVLTDPRGAPLECGGLPPLFSLSFFEGGGKPPHSEGLSAVRALGLEQLEALPLPAHRGQDSIPAAGMIVEDPPLETARAHLAVFAGVDGSLGG